MLSKNVKGYMFAVLSAVIYGSMPLMSKYIYADGVHPFSLVFLRNFLSLIPLGLLAYREHKTLKIPVTRLPDVGITSLFGCCFTPMLLFSSYRFMPSGTATVFHFIYPAVVMVAGFVFLHKKVQPISILCMVLCVGGICLFYSPQQSISMKGSALALSSAFTFATYVVLLSRFQDARVSGFLFSFYTALVCCAVSFVICVATGNLTFPATLRGWGLCVLFSLLVTTGAVVLFQQSTFLIGGEKASILSTLEPITGVLLGGLVMGEDIGPRVLIGTALVVTASILIVLPDKKNTDQ